MTRPQGHLDLDALADVLAGEGDDTHVRSCATCTEALAELAAADLTVTSALHALPAPPLPEGLSLRLTRALPETTYEMLEGVGHCPQIEAAGRVADLLLEFAAAPARRVA